MFSNIFEAIRFAQTTGNTELLDQYAKMRLGQAADAVMSVIHGKQLREDDMYFLLAFGSALVDAQLSTMSEDEKKLVEQIRNCVQMTIVKTRLPINPNNQS